MCLVSIVCNEEKNINGPKVHLEEPIYRLWFKQKALFTLKQR